MLSNPGFVNKAPEAKINQEKEKLQANEVLCIQKIIIIAQKIPLILIYIKKKNI